MDSWPLEEKMGVTSGAVLNRTCQSYQAIVAGFTLALWLSVGLDLLDTSICACLIEMGISSRRSGILRSKDPRVLFLSSSQWRAMAD